MLYVLHLYSVSKRELCHLPCALLTELYSVTLKITSQLRPNAALNSTGPAPPVVYTRAFSCKIQL